ncbi:PAS domain S-box protein [uncultured Desulfobulbus sp.]|uniref:PAS domain S-box protein n=1 Tax=uncultured Desulfobulbus sp. TaxID=239745 RepID=UPI0029C99DF8|nr:PAS domain S-box protein [uncultured Desulfobulbus sp.]
MPILDRSLGILLTCLLFGAAWPVHATELLPHGPIRVGIFPLEPLNFIGKNGVAQGLNPALLDKMGSEEDWEIEYIPCSWAECLDRLQQDQIDLMVSVAYTPERAESMEYGNEPVAEVWGQIFVHQEAGTTTIADLAGRTVAIMRKDISGTNFIRTAGSLGVQCIIKEYSTHTEVFAAVHKGEAAAGVAPQHFGRRYAGEYNLVGSPILFSPFPIYFASKKGKQLELLRHLDASLASWKKDKDSFYFRSLKKWVGNSGQEELFPPWLRFTMLITAALALIFAVLSLYLKRAVRLRTEELKESETNYRFVINSMEESLSIIDANGAFLLVNEKAAENLTGSASKEIVGTNIRELVPHEQGEQLTAAYRLVAETGQSLVQEVAVTLPSGERWFYNRLQPLEYGKSKTKAVLSLSLDITERIQAEKAQAANEQKYRDLFEANMDGISLFRITPDRTPACFLDMNESAAAMVGYSKRELAGMTATDVEKDSSPERIAQRLATLEKTGQARFETTLIAQDKREVPVEILVRSITYEGAPAMMNIVRDISKRRRAEEALRASLAEKEVLLREVHHRVKNNLAAIVGLFDLQRQAMDDPQALTILAELSGRIRSMSLVHEKLYRSESLASIDFQEYLQSLISHLRTSFGTARIQCDIAAAGVFMPLDLAVPCGMIINELVTNSLKYAFPEGLTHPEDGNCRIHVALNRDHETYTLSVADNGVGLLADFDWNTAKTVGLVLVRMLGQHQLGGRYEVDQRQGTRFTLTFTLRNRDHTND